MTDSLTVGSRTELPLWRAYLDLCKPKVVALISFTALVGMCLATSGLVPLNALIFGNLGIFLAASSAATVNHVLDSRADAMMARTWNRPLPAGRISGTQALLFAGFLATLSMTVLVLLVNPLTAALTFASLIGYAVVYTLFLKRATPQNIVIGGAAGAAPPVLGWTAVSGELDPNALLLFLIIFAWTPPHFWALAIYRRREYAQAGIPMLPVTHGVAFTSLQALFYTVLLCVVSVLPFLTGLSGPLYLAGAAILGGVFCYHAVALYRRQDDATARGMFRYSIIYLMMLFAVLLADHYWLRPVPVI